MRKILVIIISFLSTAAFSQTNTSSPYSRYGLGELTHPGLSINKGMGGTGIGLRIPNSINILNPASYTVQDTLSFIFDFGIYSNNTTYKTSSQNSKDNRASLDHIVMGMPITKWWKSSIGLLTYSKMGYDIINYQDLFVNTYKGTGGVNKFFIGNAFKIKDFSVGVNFNVLFGSLEQNHSYAYEKTEESLFPTERYQQQAIRSTSLTFGMQYDLKLSENWSMVLGGTFENRSRLISKNILLVKNAFSSIDTFPNPYTGETSQRYSLDTISYINEKIKNHLPVNYGLGISLNFKNKIIIAADYSTQSWSKYKSFNSFDKLVDSRYLNFGIQFTPDEKAIRSYWKRINIRTGFYTNDTYLKLKGHQIQDYGLSFGLRFPFKGNKSALQLSYEYGKRGTTNFNLLQENYHFFTLSLSLYDFWFIQSKFD